MPQCCVVLDCSSKTSGHRFPKDSALRKAWIIAIRRDEFTPTDPLAYATNTLLKQTSLCPRVPFDKMVGINHHNSNFVREDLGNKQKS
ncbi:hypothetical protein JTB14_030150 [Gonioctena quinquepunctata]|nr:hypothetical protein JTB14_030150 [Gonioctena quinquepunctata]